MDDEKAAHRFAGTFLVPAEALWSEGGSFQPSTPGGACTTRSSGLADAIRPVQSRLQSGRGEKPRRFRQLCLRTLAEGAISEPMVAELLGIAVRALNHRTQVPRETTETAVRRRMCRRCVGAHKPVGACGTPPSCSGTPGGPGERLLPVVAPALVLGDRPLRGFVLERRMGFDHGPPLRFWLPGAMQRGLGKAPGADSHLRGSCALPLPGTIWTYPPASSMSVA